MFVYVYSAFVLFCMSVATLRRAELPSKESTRLRIGLRNWKSGQGQKKKDCRTRSRYIADLQVAYNLAEIGGVNYANTKLNCKLLHAIFLSVLDRILDCQLILLGESWQKRQVILPYVTQ
jgi:hypothetical protein